MAVLVEYVPLGLRTVAVDAVLSVLPECRCHQLEQVGWRLPPETYPGDDDHDFDSTLLHAHWPDGKHTEQDRCEPVFRLAAVPYTEEPAGTEEQP